jgi:hypothetical protein
MMDRIAVRPVDWARRHKKWLQYGFALVVLVFLGRYLYRNWHELAGYEFALDWPSLALASGLIMLVFFLTPSCWGLILRIFLGVKISWRTSVRTWYLSQMSKYVPGSVWNYVSRVYLCGEMDIARSKVLLSIVLELVLILMAQTATFTLSLPFWSGNLSQTGWVLIILPVGLLVLHPRIFRGTLGLAGRRLGLQSIPPVTMHAGNLGLLLLLYTAGAIVVGIAFFFFANAIYPLSLELLPIMTGIVTLSLIVSFLAPFAPNGLGVREGLLVLLLGQYMPTSMAVLISLASRLWMTAGELVGLAISLRLRDPA